jgi:hypothetical protein
MRFLHSLAVRVSLGGLLFAALCASGFADSPHDRTQFGHDIFVGPGEELTEVTCFGCNVRIRGKVQGDVTIFGGNIVIEDQGEVGGDLTTFAGDVRLDKGGKISDLTVFAGRVHRDPGATVNGDITAFSGSFWLVVVFGLPLVLLGGFIAVIVFLIRRFTRPGVPVAA